MGENSARRFGPAPKRARDGDRKQARQRVNVEVRTGRRPHPNMLPCVDCGHAWAKPCDSDIAAREWIVSDRKGGDPAEWPRDLRVREMPEVRRGM